MSLAMVRTRWAAIGAVVAITLGAGGISVTNALTTSGKKSVYVPINPCRLADLRPAPNTVGPRTIGLGPSETYTLNGWGTVGNCTLPTGTTGLALNVTAVGATRQTNLRLFPAGTTTPLTSNLNPSPGAPPAPNAVNVGLSNTGQFSILNQFGTVNVIIDVVGYYDDHNHDDRYYTKAQTYTRAEIDAVHAQEKWISIDPSGVFALQGASVALVPSAGYELALPGNGGNPSFGFGFTVPTDQTPNTTMTVEFLWSINEAGCTVNLAWNGLFVSRRGSPTRFAVVPIVSDPVPGTANVVARTTMTVPAGGFGLGPGDAVSISLYREDSGDTCTLPMAILGIRVLYT